MLSTRNTVSKGDAESSSNNQPKNFLPGGYQHTSYSRREASFDWKKLWVLLLYFGAFLLSLLCVLDLIAPKAENSISIAPLNIEKTKLINEKNFFEQKSIELQLKSSGISSKSEEVKMNIEINKEFSPSSEQSKSDNSILLKELEQDSMGCYHTIPELDSGRHIVPPPPGPVKLVCCQSTKGAVSNGCKWK